MVYSTITPPLPLHAKTKALIDNDLQPAPLILFLVVVVVMVVVVEEVVHESSPHFSPFSIAELLPLTTTTAYLFHYYSYSFPSALLSSFHHHSSTS